MARLALFAALALALGACGGASEETADTGPAPTATPVDEQPTANAETPSPTAVVDDAVTETVDVVAEEASIADELGLEPIVLLTDPEGGGVRPVLAWEAVDDAAYYHVVVLSPSGRAYWAWRTPDTSVPVGGLPQLGQEAAGPEISPGMSWSVSATDADGQPIALSGRRPISP